MPIPIGGIIEVQVDGESIDISVDAVECDDGEPMAEEVIGGHGRMVGVALRPRAATITGQMHVTDPAKFRELKRKRSSTVTARFPGYTFVLFNAAFSSEGAINSEQGKAPFKFVGSGADYS